MAEFRSRAEAILLLTGGRSRRFGGGGKLQTEVVAGLRVIDIVSRNVAQVGLPVFEAGIGITQFHKVQGTQYKTPLVGVARGFDEIARTFGNSEISILVVAGDMVALDPATMRVISAFPSKGSVVPFDGSLQILGARWGPSSLEMAKFMAITHPTFSLRSALGGNTLTLDDRRWREHSPFFDIDTAEDLLAFRRNFLNHDRATRF